MGQTLSAPATQKYSEAGGNDRFLYTVSEMQGWRITMEDAHTAVLDLDEGSANGNTFFAVYDGHGGGTVAKYAGQNLHKRLVTEETYQAKDYEAALKRAFLGTDEDLLANPTHTRDPSGCTAVAALVTHDGKIYVANAGDSRSVIGVKGEVKPLSFDHKPSNEVEKTRISEAGGYIEYGRVNGNLALSRALGDFEFKKNYSISPEKQVITADPDITCHEISEEDEFLVLACDGIWDCLTSQQVVDIIRYQVSQGKELTEIGEMMCDHCLAPDTSSGAGIGCDNMTILIVAILHGRTKEEWYEWIRDRVEKEHGYKTPSTLPKLYALSRLMSFRARLEAREARERSRQQDQDDTPSHGFLGISSNNTKLMFGNDDDDDDDEEEEDDTDEENIPGAHLDAYENDLSLEKGIDHDGDSHMDGAADEAITLGTVMPKLDATHLEGEASVPPKPTVNGDATTLISPVEQLKSQPGGDEPDPVIRVEGFLDSSEDPLKG